LRSPVRFSQVEGSILRTPGLWVQVDHEPELVVAPFDAHDLTEIARLDHVHEVADAGRPRGI
jgi:hypothetical protein